MYSKRLSTKNPGCVVILVDQSSSMADPIGRSHVTKKVACAKAVNNVLYQLVFSCATGDQVKDRIYVGLIGYGAGVGSAFQASLAGRQLVPISEIAKSPLRLDTDAQGTQQPVWLDPVAGGSTPMAQAFQLAQTWLAAWLSEHSESYPPIVINITDGEPDNAATAKSEAQALLQLTSQDGSLLMLNAHLSNTSNQEITFPSKPTSLPDQYAQYLFDLSSILPESMLAVAQSVGIDYEGNGCRGFVYNANADTLVRLLTFGTTVGLR